MNETVDPFEFIDPDEIDRELEEAIRYPIRTPFAEEKKRKVGIKHSIPHIDRLTVDIQNRNIYVNYSIQEPEEQYILVQKDQKHSLIENAAITMFGKKHRQVSVSYYLVTPEKTLFHTGRGYVETPIRRPREVHRISDEAIERALEMDSIDFKPASQLGGNRNENMSPSVPPPQGYNPKTDIQ